MSRTGHQLRDLSTDKADNKSNTNYSNDEDNLNRPTTHLSGQGRGQRDETCVSKKFVISGIYDPETSSPSIKFTGGTPLRRRTPSSYSRVDVREGRRGLGRGLRRTSRRWGGDLGGPGCVGHCDVPPLDRGRWTRQFVREGTDDTGVDVSEGSDFTLGVRDIDETSSTIC